MALELTVGPARTEISSHESLTVHCVLRNGGTGTERLPGPYDRSGAFNIVLRDGAGNLVRSMNRQTRQRMLSDGRVDGTLDTEELPSGEQWQWPMDLASFQFSLPAGAYTVSGRLVYPPENLDVESAKTSLNVREDPVCFVGAMRDNPVIDSVSLLIGAESESGRQYFLRQHNYSRPCGAWYAARIPAPPDGGEPFFAPAGYYQAESFDPAFSKWIVMPRGAGTVEAYRFVSGAPRARRKAPVPAGLTLVRSAFHMAGGELLLFFWGPAGRLECHRLDDAGLTKLFEHDPRVPAGTAISIGAFADTIHLAIPRRGVVYERLSMDGVLRDRVRAFRTPYEAVAVTYEPVVHRIRALFADARRSQTVQVAVIDLKKEAVSSYTWDRFPLRGGIGELSFDQDEGGRFHLLATTRAKRLYYLSEGRGPVLVAEGEDAYHPVVCAPRKVYLGFYRRSLGFRFVQYQRRRTGAKFVGLEPHPAME